MDAGHAPAGWYPDADGRRLRYWDGQAWTAHVAERPASSPQWQPARHGANWVAIGVVSAVLAFPAAAFLFLVAALTANACGPFADGCDDYGETAPGFVLFLAGSVLAACVAVAGVVVAIVAAARRRRRP